MTTLLAETEVVARVFDHIDHGTTDLSADTWREPVANYLSPERFQAELALMRRTPTPFCPSAMLRGPGSYLARSAAGVPLVAVRGSDGVVRAFRNACRHRGAQVACGAGQQKSFVCPYHGWTYGLDGALRGVPGEHGFPGLDKGAHGLAPVRAHEHGGLVYITQEPAEGDDAAYVATLPTLFGPTYELVSDVLRETRANWKICAEGFLEGYHIYATHRDTFYPAQYDNLAVIETFDRNSRVTFPYRTIERLRGAPQDTWNTESKLTYLYHLFPNVMIATLPKRILMVVLEPVHPGLTHYHRYTLARAEDLAAHRDAIDKGVAFGLEGEKEDRMIVESIQRGLASQGNDAFVFGRFEGAITHFHRNLHAVLADTA
ncbi:aromatic ring-hydroxylating dioxygenase subunit alpha [Phenylobacterium sp.]|uniref:aromatic ring-hydroxylating oxygenase subunit alpha n=1 Tax=Phenylobacterium sp. TaxID=1871053 RepID=UPI0025CC7530|nr:aromatic ring-hydroxylating dioxygenase subunit alpha [Phenylobacterium sp.]MBX3482039.1 aromatic ring-hydroxylating dioxygenase subunit alpha [Phenylobacterium sp.]MCW5758503.1 aromatic ring-hydroxylating dioxygenase subunit alpha [Phenylobacterium sp.]